MAISQPNITVDLVKNTSCTAIALADVTGIYGVDGNVDGYGISNGPSINDVSSVTVILTYNSLSTFITFVFTIVNGVITACTLTIQNGTPVNIFAQLTSTVWPFTTETPFNFYGDYGVDIPPFTDEIFSVSYTVAGDIGMENFEFVAIKNKEITCSSQCCTDKKFTDMDWLCDCAGDKIRLAMYGQALINQVIGATKQGDLTTALSALAKVKTLCSETSGGCGCG